MEAGPGRADAETLRQLLSVQAETASLDFKRSFDLDSRRDVVELAKDIAAMAAEGGHLVVGADDHGNVGDGISGRQAKLFDEATVRGKIGKYLPSDIEFTCGVHDIDGATLAVVAVMPHPAGVCIMRADGNVDGRDPVFRAGDVFVRRGTASTRWAQDDVVRLIDRLRSRVREETRREVRLEWEAATRAASAAAVVSEAPAAALSWVLDLEAFVDAVVEQLRRGDEIPLRRLLLTVPRELADYSRQPRGIDRTADLLDRLGALLVEFVVTGRDDLIVAVMLRMVAAYERTLADPHPAEAVPAALLGTMEVERMYALGALAVRERRFDVVRTLTTWPVRAPRSPVPFWLLHAQRHSEYSGVLQSYAAAGGSAATVVSLASGAAARHRHLAPDLASGDESLVTSLCEFDFLHAVVAVAAVGADDRLLVPTSFAGWFSWRTDSVAAELVAPGSAVRGAIFGGTDAELAATLETIEQTARGWGPPGRAWDGYEDQRVRAFIEQQCG